MTDFVTSRTTMVDTQIRPSDVTKYPIIEAMLTVPREAFVPEDQRATCYAERLVPFPGGRAMLEPRTLAKMLDALDIGSGDMVLDIGCLLGYSAALIARMAEFVVALEEDEALAAEAQALLSEHGADNVAVVTGPLAEGDPRHGPYDVILVEGAVEALPEALTAQLSEGGRIACLFAEKGSTDAWLGMMLDGALTWRHLFTAGAPLLPGFAAKHEFAF